MTADLAAIVRAAAAREEVRRAVADVYSDLQSHIDSRRPVCIASGRCCRFDEFGHRLYVTTMELACFSYDVEQAGNDVHARADEGGCRFQKSKLCGVHAIRPFGCRIFFCDATSTQWQQDLYKQMHDRFRRLHYSLSVPYFYLEWRPALAAVFDGNPA